MKLTALVVLFTANSKNNIVTVLSYKAEQQQEVIGGSDFTVSRKQQARKSMFPYFWII